YNQEAAWSKVWLIFLAVLLYYALAGQPSENLEWVCVFFFCIGVGVSIYFFLTLNIGSGSPLKWTPIHQNYAAGVAAITTPFILYPARQSKGKNSSAFLRVIAIVGVGIASLAIVLANSRGILLAIATACSVWTVWSIFNRIPNRTWLHPRQTFPLLVYLSLCAVVLYLYMGPANAGYGSTDVPYTTGSREELLVSGIRIASDFPFTGGGLGSFPGLYAYYMLGIPFFYFINSHNLFLDVAIEQGLLGGLSFLMIFLVRIWSVAKNIVRTGLPGVQLFGWLALGALIIAFVHGMVDDYLYNGSGTMLALALAGLSNSVQSNSMPTADRKNRYIFVLIPLGLIFFSMINLNGFHAAWLSNLGAVQMAKVELAGFPTNEWTEPAIAPELEAANITFRAALQANPRNRTANHRLGLISMLRGDFLSASEYLERAHAAVPDHRGIVKSLGYCYVWLGDMEKALPFLRDIPEAKDELEVYVWWWDVHGRPDLSVNASRHLAYLNDQKDQP
ncbi:MAG: O-antigen ligase family protein, partial [Anaerolineales bacterium]